MPIPRYCARPDCPNHRHPKGQWRMHFGSYHTLAHGTVRRFRCRLCGTTVSEQSHSLHYFAKRRVPLRAVWNSLLAGASQREIARRYGLSPMAIHNAVLRLGRQAMAAHAQLLSTLRPRSALVLDGLRSFVSSQDHPCDLTTVVDREREVILSVAHTVTRRGGRMRRRQQTRVAAKERVWHPQRGAMREDISRLTGEIWEYLRASPTVPAVLDTDEHPLYRSVLSRCKTTGHFREAGLFAHLRTPSTAPRTVENRLFPVNYIDRLLRHRLREHTRETIAFGRHATMQMHRMWIFATDHNLNREYRVKQPELGVHAAGYAEEPERARELNRGFFTRRISLRDSRIPGTMQAVWRNELPTPPHRWKRGQAGTTVRIPGFALRDLAEADQQGC